MNNQTALQTTAMNNDTALQMNAANVGQQKYGVDQAQGGGQKAKAEISQILGNLPVQQQQVLESLARTALAKAQTTLTGAQTAQARAQTDLTKAQTTGAEASARGQSIENVLKPYREFFQALPTQVLQLPGMTVTQKQNWDKVIQLMRQDFNGDQSDQGRKFVLDNLGPNSIEQLQKDLRGFTEQILDSLTGKTWYGALPDNMQFLGKIEK